jgi:hypothetical protein
LHDSSSSSRKLKTHLVAIRELSLSRADRNAHLIATTGFIFICTQFVLFARLTWWDSDWDVMEPVTWVTGVVEMVVGGMAYYLFKGMRVTPRIWIWIWFWFWNWIFSFFSFDFGFWFGLWN